MSCGKFSAGSGNLIWEWEGMGMKINNPANEIGNCYTWEWEGTEIKNPFPNTSNQKTLPAFKASCKLYESFLLKTALFDFIFDSNISPLTNNANVRRNNNNNNNKSQNRVNLCRRQRRALLFQRFSIVLQRFNAISLHESFVSDVDPDL